VATSELGTAWRRTPRVAVRRDAGRLGDRDAGRAGDAGRTGDAGRAGTGRLSGWRELPWRRVGALAVVVVLAVLTVAISVVLHLDRSVTRVEVGGLGAPGSGTPTGGPAVGPPGAPHDGITDEAASGGAAHPGGAALPDGAAPAEDHRSDAPADGSATAGSHPVPLPEVRVEETVGEPLTVLVVGSDTREVLTAEERRRLRTGDFWGERTEVIALVRLDPHASSLRVVHVPRDTALERCDGTRGRVNAAHAIGERDGTGGLTCLVETLTAWSGLTIDHLVKVDFRGFIDIVDAIGGVEMELEAPLRDDRSGLDLPAGTVRLDGEDALSFVRARHLDDDFGRIARQQRFLREVQAEVRELGVLSDVGRLVRLAEATARAVELDDSLTLWRLRALVLGHRETIAKPLDSHTVPGLPDTSTGAYLVEPDEQAAEELFAWLVTGEETGAAAPDAQRVPGHPDAPAGAEEPDR
jgi:LCP family protein required for cell wall assembly